jgi:hypothetical protein
MQATNNNHSHAIRWLTSIGAVLGCSVLLTPLLGLRGVWFHLIYGGLYLVFSMAYAWCVIKTGRHVPGFRRLEAWAGRWFIVSLLVAMVIGTLIYFIQALRDWQAMLA